jgi:hypothetical protein
MGDPRADEVSDVDEDDDERVDEQTTRTRPRKSECGYVRIQLRTMSVAERTKYDAARKQLVGLCCHCTLDWRPIREAFVPRTDSERTKRRADMLSKALDDYDNAFANDSDRLMTEALDVVHKKRTSHCRTCGNAANKRSPNELACKLEWHRMKYEACATHGGCPKPECTEKGMASWVCMSADHVDPETKVFQLSAYKFWASPKRGVEAMRREALKVQWMCRCCHMLEPTSATGRTESRTTPSDERVREKAAYVNAHKLKVGKCQYDGCNRIVTATTVRAFDLDHNDPKQKATHETHPHLIKRGRRHGGVAGIVNNHATALADVKKELDEELRKCALLCANCHNSRKPQGRARWDASSGLAVGEGPSCASATPGDERRAEEAAAAACGALAGKAKAPQQSNQQQMAPKRSNKMMKKPVVPAVVEEPDVETPVVEEPAQVVEKPVETPKPPPVEDDESDKESEPEPEKEPASEPPAKKQKKPRKKKTPDESGPGPAPTSASTALVPAGAFSYKPTLEFEDNAMYLRGFIACKHQETQHNAHRQQAKETELIDRVAELEMRLHNEVGITAVKAANKAAAEKTAARTIFSAPVAMATMVQPPPQLQFNGAATATATATASGGEEVVGKKRKGNFGKPAGWGLKPSYFFFAAAMRKKIAEDADFKEKLRNEYGWTSDAKTAGGGKSDEVTEQTCITNEWRKIVYTEELEEKTASGKAKKGRKVIVDQKAYEYWGFKAQKYREKQEAAKKTYDEIEDEAEKQSFFEKHNEAMKTYDPEPEA